MSLACFLLSLRLFVVSSCDCTELLLLFDLIKLDSADEAAVLVEDQESIVDLQEDVAVVQERRQVALLLVVGDQTFVV